MFCVEVVFANMAGEMQNLSVFWTLRSGPAQLASLHGDGGGTDHFKYSATGLEKQGWKH